MLRLNCPCCGERDETEFAFGGPSHAVRPLLSASDAEWAAYLFQRENPRGIQYERWCHAYGCGRWFNVARDTATDRVLAVYAVGSPKPDLSSGSRA